MSTVNLVSNERSYLHVVPALCNPRLHGGAYVGVGPDQNLSYIAHLRPAIAFILDVRRENLLLHLLFKAVFRLCATRIEYLCRHFGRPAPRRPGDWHQASVEDLVAYVDGTTATSRDRDAALQSVRDTIGALDVPLSAADLDTADGIHRRLIAAGLDLRFETPGLSILVPDLQRPTYRELLLARDLEGRHRNFLADDASYGTVRELQRNNGIVLVAGNLSGPSALRHIGRTIQARGLTLAAFYTSNAEFYLFANGTFPRFIQNLAHLPRNADSVVVRAVFPEMGLRLPLAPQFGCMSLVQPVDDLLAGCARGRFKHYSDLSATPPDPQRSATDYRATGV
jgi:hypothetical protein